MSQLPSLIKAIKAKWSVTVGTTVIPLYHLSSPADVDYPLATFNVVSAPSNYAMKGDGGKALHYMRPVIRFNLYLNEAQMGDGTGWTAFDIIQGLYHLESLTLDSGRCMAAYQNDVQVTFYEDGEKIYRMSQEYRFFTGE